MKAVQLIRSSLFMTGMIVAVLVYWPVCVVAVLLPPFPRSRIIGVWAHAVLFWLKITCGLSHKVEGMEKLPEGPAVIFAKHQSAWETISFQTIFPPQAWVMKRSLLYIPFFGWGLAASRPIAIDRSTQRQALLQVVEQGIEKLKEGRWVVIFPEGTRTAPGEHGKFNASAALLAARAKVPLVPVAHNSGDFWRRREFNKRAGTIHVRVGEPIYPENRKVRELNNTAENWVRSTMPVISDAYVKETESGGRKQNHK